MEAALSSTPPAARGTRAVQVGPFVRILLLGAVVGAVLLIAFLALVRNEQHVALGGEIVHDDFGFRVREVGARAALGQPERRASGRWLVVSFDVNNHARRVPFDLTTWTPVLVDASGATFEPDENAERVLAAELSLPALRDGSIDAGESRRCRAVFDVPADARELRFAISWGGETVDLLDRLIFGAKDIALGAVEAAGPR